MIKIDFKKINKARKYVTIIIELQAKKASKALTGYLSIKANIRRHLTMPVYDNVRNCKLELKK